MNTINLLSNGCMNLLFTHTNKQPQIAQDVDITQTVYTRPSCMQITYTGKFYAISNYFYCLIINNLPKYKFYLNVSTVNHNNDVANFSS